MRSKLDMKLGDDETKNLNATLAAATRERFQLFYRNALSELPTEGLSREGKLIFKAHSPALFFFISLFSEVAQERNRSALEKLQSEARH